MGDSSLNDIFVDTRLPFYKARTGNSKTTHRKQRHPLRKRCLQNASCHLVSLFVWEAFLIKVSGRQTHPLRGRILAAGFGALALLYRQSSFSSTTGHGKMIIMDTWRGPKRATEELRVPPLWVMTLEKSMRTWQTWTGLSHPPPALCLLPSTGNSTAYWVQNGHKSKGQSGSSWPALWACLAHYAEWQGLYW